MSEERVATIIVSSVFVTKDGAMAICNIMPHTSNLVNPEDIWKSRSITSSTNYDFVVKLADLSPLVQQQIRDGHKQFKAMIQFEDIPEGRQLKIDKLEAQ